MSVINQMLSLMKVRPDLKEASFARYRASSNKIAAVILYLFVYLLLTLPIATLPVSPSGLSIFFLCSYALLAIGLSWRLTEHILAFIWLPIPVSLAALPLSKNKIGVVMTLCDDWSLDIIQRLTELRNAGYDIYLLDDSTQPVTLPHELADKFRIIKRHNRKGAKGGNLNNWLKKYSKHYDFLCILDADSIMPLEALNKLSRAAGHPANDDIAVFQAKIMEDASHSPTLQARLTGINNKPRALILERVHARLGLLLSHGHNQLVRIAAVNEVGGFEENLSHEDTVLSLALSQKGWHTVLVDTWTYDREPVSFEAYARRTVRWARQTVEIFSRSWFGAPLSLKLMMCEWLLAYLSPFLVINLLAVTLWLGPSAPNTGWQFTYLALSCTEGFKQIGVAMWINFWLLFLLFFFQYSLARLYASPRRLILFSWIHGITTMTFLSFPLVLYMILTALGKPVAFVPTNINKVPLTSSQKGMSMLIKFSGLLIVIILCVGALLHPGSLFFGLTGLWVLLAIISPLIILIVKIKDNLNPIDNSCIGHPIVKSTKHNA